MGPGVNSVCTIDLLTWFPCKLSTTWTIATEYKYTFQSKPNSKILSLKESEYSPESQRKAAQRLASLKAAFAVWSGLGGGVLCRQHHSFGRTPTSMISFPKLHLEFSICLVFCCVLSWHEGIEIRLLSSEKWIMFYYIHIILYSSQRTCKPIRHKLKYLRGQAGVTHGAAVVRPWGVAGTVVNQDMYSPWKFKFIFLKQLLFYSNEIYIQATFTLWTPFQIHTVSPELLATIWSWLYWHRVENEETEVEVSGNVAQLATGGQGWEIEVLWTQAQLFSLKKLVR